MNLYTSFAYFWTDLGEIRGIMSNNLEFCKNCFTERLALLKGAHFTSDFDKIRYRIVL
jgi:hypothetical protein